MALSRQSRYRLIEIILILLAAVSGATIVINLFQPDRHGAVLFFSGLIFTSSLLAFLNTLLNPMRVRASQSNQMLSLAGQTLQALSPKGLNKDSAQTICELVLPATSAIAVSITDKENILGYAGRDKEYNETGAPIRTSATKAVLDDGQVRILHTQEEIGLPSSSAIHAAIVVPLRVGNEAIGTLKFYYPTARRLNETEESIALRFAELLATQVSARALDEQRKLATSMELKVLQSQINPHFLFNTINTIASFIRTDPDRARELLREFAVFYRRTLEDATDLIPLSRELEQTQRYLGFEMARFGEERLQFLCDIDEAAQQSLVPAFMLQPIVENAVRHAMPTEGTLHISCTVTRSGADLNVSIEDDGVGMSQESREKFMQGGSSEGLGIALKNIQERIRGYYGPDSYMQVESEEGKGTRVFLFLKGSCAW